jgi:hypothetical protein
MTPKHSMRLSFSSAFGGEPLQLGGFFPARAGETAPATSFKKWNLRNPTQDSWTYSSGFNDVAGGGSLSEEAIRTRAKYITDAWMVHHMAVLGHPVYHRRFVNVFLNGKYWGVYEAIERADADWLKGSGQTDAAGNVTGDVLIAQEDSPNDSTPELEADAGSKAAWNALRANSEVVSAQASAATTVVQNDAADAAYAAAILPAVDETNLIDYMLLNIWAQSEDWPHHNFIVVRWKSSGDPPAGKFRFMPWDSEITLKRNADYLRLMIAFKITPRLNDGPGWLFDKLRQVRAFRNAVLARMTVLTTGAGGLTPTAVQTSWRAIADEFNSVVDAEAMRWGHVFPKTGLGDQRWKRADWEAAVNSCTSRGVWAR